MLLFFTKVKLFLHFDKKTLQNDIYSPDKRNSSLKQNSK